MSHMGPGNHPRGGAHDPNRMHSHPGPNGNMPLDPRSFSGDYTNDARPGGGFTGPNGGLPNSSQNNNGRGNGSVPEGRYDPIGPFGDPDDPRNHNSQNPRVHPDLNPPHGVYPSGDPMNPLVPQNPHNFRPNPGGGPSRGGFGGGGFGTGSMNGGGFF